MSPPPETTAPVQALLQAIQDENQTGLTDALAAIASSGHAHEVALALADRLRLPSEVDVRVAAIYGLTRLGDSASAAVPALGHALADDPDWNVRRLALSALESIDPIEGIPYFQQVLDDAELGELALTSIGIALRRAVAKSEQLPEGTDQLKTVFSDVKSETLVTLLNRSVNLEDASISAAAVVALATAYPTEAIEPLCAFLTTWLRQQEKAEQGLAVAAADTGAYEAGRQRTAVTVIRRLGQLGDPRAVGCLGETLTKNLHTETRKFAAKSLALFVENETAIRALCRAALGDREKDVRAEVARLLQSVPSWRKKTDATLRVLATELGQHRGTLDATLIVEALTPPESATEPATALTDYLIAQVERYGADQRVVAMLAVLVVASTGGVLQQAADRLNAYQRESQVQEDIIRPLRMAIGGEALQPYLERLSEQLEKDFLAPVRSLNVDTNKTWQRTIIVAYVGFALRTLMSVILFGVGMFLVLSSYRSLLSGRLDADTFLGSGISFVAGLGTMVGVTFAGPLREIRKSVSDVGASSAVFIAYIHSIFQISHTFSAFYQRGDVTFTELTESSKLVEATMRAALQELNRREGDVPSASLTPEPPPPSSPTQSPDPAPPAEHPPGATETPPTA